MNIRRHVLVVLFSSLVLLFVSAVGFAGSDVSNQFIMRNGTLPLILCAPHGGTEDLPGIAERTRGLLQPDVNTDLVAMGLYEEILKLTGGSPYLIISKIKRDEIDFNRPVLPERQPFGGWERAFADRRAEKYWKFYHATIEEYKCSIFQHSYPIALLLDIHGHERPRGTEDALAFGDEHGASVVALFKGSETAAAGGPSSIMGIMASKGYRVLANLPEFAGGFSVRHHSGPWTAAILIEIPEVMRRVKGLREALVRDLAEAIVLFLDRYLLSCPRLRSEQGIRSAD